MPDDPVLTMEQAMKILKVERTKFYEIRENSRFVALKVEIEGLTNKFSRNNLQRYIDGETGVRGRR